MVRGPHGWMMKRAPNSKEGGGNRNPPETLLQHVNKDLEYAKSSVLGGLFGRSVPAKPASKPGPATATQGYSLDLSRKSSEFSQRMPGSSGHIAVSGEGQSALLSHEPAAAPAAAATVDQLYRACSVACTPRLLASYLRKTTAETPRQLLDKTGKTPRAPAVVPSTPRQLFDSSYWT